MLGLKVNRVFKRGLWSNLFCLYLIKTSLILEMLCYKAWWSNSSRRMHTPIGKHADEQVLSTKQVSQVWKRE